MLNKKIATLESTLRKAQNENKAFIDELRASQQSAHQQLDQQIRLEAKSNQHFAERLNTAVKEEIATLRNESEKLASTVQVITTEINELHDRLKP